MFNSCSRRRRGRGPRDLAAILSPADRRDPAAAATAAQIEMFAKPSLKIRPPSTLLGMYFA